AVASAVKSRCVNNGQSCIAAKRFIIHQDLYEGFRDRMVAAMDALKIGDPTKDETELGPLATSSLVNELMAQVKAAIEAGGTVLCGGDRMLGTGNFFEPTVIEGVPRTAAVYREEIFGPIALLFPAASLAEAIEIANDTPFGLAASAWTTDPEEQKRFQAQLQCGAVFLNTMVASDPRLPFGGIKRSGYGRELSAAGMREFLNAKTVVIAEAPERVEVTPPPVEPVEVEDEMLPRGPVDSVKFSKALENALHQRP
ncbi:MAG: aldehyde dehydrogenase family protein, partial [Janthinobacterium lividum]